MSRFMPRFRLGQKLNITNLDDFLSGFPVFIQTKEVLQHIVVLGKSGTGKTSILLNWIFSLILSGVAFILIEPAGFMAADAFSASRGRARYLSLKHPTGLNPMLLPYEPEVVSSVIREAINQVINLATEGANKALTAKMNVLLDQAIQECLADGRTSLMNVLAEIQRMSKDAETRDGIAARLKFLLADKRMRAILCGPNTIDVGQMSTRGDGLIVDCAGMSTEQLTFVGNLVSQAVKAHLRHADHTKLNPLCLILDECQNFISPNWTTILREGRKYQLSAVLASTDLAHFDEKTRRVLMNVGSLLAFRLGSQEANHVARELQLDPHLLQSAEKHHLFYLTPSDTGYAKAPYPPAFKKYSVPAMDPSMVVAEVPSSYYAGSSAPSTRIQSSTVPYSATAHPKNGPPRTPEIHKPANREPMPKIEWFPLQPFPPPATTTPEAAPVEALEAETPPSNNLDGSCIATGTSA